MIERILVGTDGSDAAADAGSLALRLARATDARVQAMHVLEEPALYGVAPAYDPRIQEAREDAGQRFLDDLADRAGKLGVHVDTVLEEGRPAPVLLDEAERWGADLVAVGTQGHGPLARAIVGSVADELVRTSPLPVLTARDASPGEAMDPIARILLPSDASQEAQAAAPLALALAEQTGAEIDLLHAIAPEMEGGAYLDRPASEIDEAHEEMADQALGPLEAACSDAGVPCQRFVPHARAHRAIVEHAEERGADLVVMATHGRGGIERFLLGSVTDKVVRTAGAPVITVRPGADG